MTPNGRTPWSISTKEVGIMGVPGDWRYPDAFMGARWIWTVSLVFDNTVLLRKTVR